MLLSDRFAWAKRTLGYVEQKWHRVRLKTNWPALCDADSGKGSSR